MNPPPSPSPQPAAPTAPLRALSVLIPTRNRACAELVRTLQAQAEDIDGLRYEIVVADDASTCPDTRSENREIRKWDGCRLIELPENVGRARIRNLLAREAQHDALLFLDSDVLVTADTFVRRYLDCAEARVAYGGVAQAPSAELLRSNLRYRYELACAPDHTAQRRRLAPFQSFRTTNFLVRRDVMLGLPFDERFMHYGYEDVLFGKRLREAGIDIMHIENPVVMDDYEENADFLRKTDEALDTLHHFRADLRGYSALLSAADRLHRCGLDGLAARLFAWAEPSLRRRLLGEKPSVRLYQLYRLGRYLQIGRAD